MAFFVSQIPLHLLGRLLLIYPELISAFVKAYQSAMDTSQARMAANSCIYAGGWREVSFMSYMQGFLQDNDSFDKVVDLCQTHEWAKLSLH